MTQRRFSTLAHAAEAYYQELRRFVLQRTGSPALADDIVQETWIRASTAGVVMPDNPRAYLYRMARNLAVDYERRRRAIERAKADEAVPEDIASADPPPDAAVAARQELKILLHAVQELPEKCRRVFILYRGEGLTMREIAMRLGISDKTVEKHIARAMIHCRRRLREAGRDV
jgi:RNA polymerase sigma-70 factor (ECF subfamily)